MSWLAFIAGYILQTFPDIPGRHRLRRWWVGRPQPFALRIGRLPSGGKINCDVTVPCEAMIWLQREEWDDLGQLRRLLSPGQTFVDVGANIGTWSVEAATHVGTAGKVISFEPNPLTVRKLQANVDLNRLQSRIVVHPVAVSAARGIVFMQYSREHNISHVNEEQTADAVQVHAVTLDVCLGSEPVVHGMKIDVEGHEHAVLRGAAGLIERCHPWIVIEFNITLARATRLGDWNVHQWLQSRGYHVEAMPSTRARIVTEAYQPRSGTFANLLYRWSAKSAG